MDIQNNLIISCKRLAVQVHKKISFSLSHHPFFPPLLLAFGVYVVCVYVYMCLYAHTEML